MMNNAIEDIDALAGSFVFDERALAPLKAALQDKIRNYGGQTGPILQSHLARTSQRLGDFMAWRGYSEQIVENVRQCFDIHDVGKTLQRVELYNLAGKPGSDVKRERRAHTVLGCQAIDAEADRLQKAGKIDRIEITPAINLMKAFCLQHHERLNGIGPLGFKADNMGEILRMATIVDEADGKLKACGFDEVMVLESMAGDKHNGQFDADLLKSYRAMREPHIPRGPSMFLPGASPTCK